MNIADEIRKIVKPLIKAQIINGTVKSFDQSTWSIEVEIEGLKLPCRIKSVINDGDKGICVQPKLGSNVLLGLIENKEEALVALKFDEIEKYKLDADVIEMNGNSYSIVKAEKLQQILSQHKAFIDAFKSILQTPIPEPGNASPSAFQAALNVALSSLQFPDGTGIENNTVKHG